MVDVLSVDGWFAVPLASGSVSPRRRLTPLVVLSFKPRAVAFNRIWCLHEEIRNSHSLSVAVYIPCAAVTPSGNNPVPINFAFVRILLLTLCCELFQALRLFF